MLDTFDTLPAAVLERARNTRLVIFDI
ncbi:MAG: hypothetical protein RL122_2821, partial [Pseudomonadota bacterium]